MFRDMAIDAGAVTEAEIKWASQNIFLDFVESMRRPEDEHDLLGEMQYRGVTINALPPVIEETPDITA
jgi:hypothetical protein